MTYASTKLKPKVVTIIGPLVVNYRLLDNDTVHAQNLARIYEVKC